LGMMEARIGEAATAAAALAQAQEAEPEAG
jgi:hypothetical protein